jgi:hypothetical protein
MVLVAAALLLVPALKIAWISAPVTLLSLSRKGAGAFQHHRVEHRRAPVGAATPEAGSAGGVLVAARIVSGWSMLRQAPVPRPADDAVDQGGVGAAADQDILEIERRDEGEIGQPQELARRGFAIVVGIDLQVARIAAAVADALDASANWIEPL